MCKAGCSHGCVIIKDSRVNMVKDSNAARAKRALAHVDAVIAELDAMPIEVRGLTSDVLAIRERIKAVL